MNKAIEVKTDADAPVSLAIKQAVQREVDDSVKRWNSRGAGIYWNRLGEKCGCSLADYELLRDASIVVKDDCVYKSGRKIAVIHRNFHARRTHLYYKQKKATIEWLVKVA